MESGAGSWRRTSAITSWEGGAEHMVLRHTASPTPAADPSRTSLADFSPVLPPLRPPIRARAWACACVSIISMYKGTIDVESELGHGTDVIRDAAGSRARRGEEFSPEDIAG